MGLNVNLVKMLGLPTHVTCPHCNKSIVSFFEDFDLECFEISPRCELSFHCLNCGEDFKAVIEIEATVIT
jgi:hypothetical protein